MSLARNCWHTVGHATTTFALTVSLCLTFRARTTNAPNVGLVGKPDRVASWTGYRFSNSDLIAMRDMNRLASSTLPIRRMRLTNSVSRIVSASIIFALAACGRSDGRTNPNRVVSVSKQINEFIYDIGAQDNLVAKDLTSIYPPAIKKLPSVGYHRALSAEGIISMKPTLFLTDGNVGPDAVIEQVKKVGIPVLIIKPGNSLDSARALMTQLGKQFNRQAAADSVLAAWSKGMDSVWSDTAKWANKPRPRVLIMHMGQIVNNYLGVGGGGPADQMLKWAGATNAIDSARSMTRLNPELIAKLAPDIIIATDVGFDRFGSAEKFATLPGVDLTPAGKNKRIYRIDETEMLYFGPRTPATVRKLEAMLHPPAS
jgi:iron complex transport system substrate-binding protein